MFTLKSLDLYLSLNDITELHYSLVAHFYFQATQNMLIKVVQDSQPYLLRLRSLSLSLSLLLDLRRSRDLLLFLSDARLEWRLLEWLRRALLSLSLSLSLSRSLSLSLSRSRSLSRSLSFSRSFSRSFSFSSSSLRFFSLSSRSRSRSSLSLLSTGFSPWGSSERRRSFSYE